MTSSTPVTTSASADEPVSTPLGRTAARGAAWMGAAQLLRQLIQLGAGILLARLLTPSDFGLVAVVWAVASLAFPFTELGLTTALVRRPDLQPKDQDSAFWLNLASGITVAGVVAFLAPFLGAAYHEPRLVDLLFLSCANFVLATNVVQTAWLERHLRFKLLATLDLVAQSVGWTVAVVCAVLGLGVWSLLIGPQITLAIQAVAVWTIVRWRPRSAGTRRSYRELWRFGRGVIVFQLADLSASNVDSISIPAVAGALQLGLYNRAYNLTRLPVQQTQMVLGRVFVPVLSTIKDDKGRLRAVTEKAFVISAAVGLPVALVLIVNGPLLVPVLFGQQWKPMVPYLQLLAVASVPQFLSSGVWHLYQVLDRTKALARFGLVQSCLTVAAVLAGLHWGALGVCVALVIRMWFGAPLLMGPPLALVGISVPRAGRLLVGVAGAGIVWACASVLVECATGPMPDLVRLLLAVGLSAAAYLAALRVFSRDAWAHVRGLVR